MDSEIIHKAGCVGGAWQSDQAEGILKISQIFEKPTVEYARENLHIAGMPENQFLGIFGMYILESEIFKLLGAEIKNHERLKGEFQLTTCLDKLRETTGAIAYLVQGKYYDTGMPLFYRQAMIDYYANS